MFVWMTFVKLMSRWQISDTIMIETLIRETQNIHCCYDKLEGQFFWCNSFEDDKHTHHKYLSALLH